MKFLKELFLSARFFTGMWIGVFALVLAYVFPVLYPVALAWPLLLGLLAATELFLLFAPGRAVAAERIAAERFSNGDDNPVEIKITNGYRFRTFFRIVDEAPVELQRRDLEQKLAVDGGGAGRVTYFLRPVRRGAYEFGRIRVFASSFLGLAERRYSFGEATAVAVYPAYLHMRKYELIAFGRQHAHGVRRIRVAGVSYSFDQIKPYVPGDDPRTVNWKATAKCNRLMVNSYAEERSQPVYCLIDKGRSMQSPFNGMTLLDYAINASLALSDVVLKRGDRSGLLAFSRLQETFVKADNRGGQLHALNEALYKQQTAFGETDFEQLCAVTERRVQGRSLLILFTNFESRSSLERQLPALRRLAGKHLLLVVLFENAEIKKMVQETPETLYDIYFQAIASGFIREKRQMVSLLRGYGIHAISCSPEQLTVDTINTYLGLKERGSV
ncbi:MAG: DUF58 domain-containing protein [Culturomica sp.]|jgi:uncharacterized protein (DUF58 family)|nr:DUF58 domain-containing protein [Culturomica sp.]